MANNTQDAITEDQRVQIDDITWEHEETLYEDIFTRKAEFRELVHDLKAELNVDLKEIRNDARDVLKEAIKDLKASWT